MVVVGPCQLLAVRVEKLVTGVHISTPHFWVLHTVTISATSTISDLDLLSAVPPEHLASLLPGSGPRFLLLHAPAGTGYTVISLDSRQLVTSVASEPLLQEETLEAVAKSARVTGEAVKREGNRQASLKEWAQSEAPMAAAQAATITWCIAPRCGPDIYS